MQVSIQTSVCNPFVHVFAKVDIFLAWDASSLLALMKPLAKRSLTAILSLSHKTLAGTAVEC